MQDPTTFSGFREHISEERFDVVMQPILDLRSNEISHHEWLVRFDHSDGLAGVLRPAERSGAIMDLDLFMMARAILVLNEQSEGPSIAVNISGASFDEEGFEYALMACLSALTAPAEKLIIELTETWHLSDLDKAKDLLARLRARGHKICLDDVGAGAASIHYLRAFPADYLKIDGDFVKAAMSDKQERAILDALLSLSGPLQCKFIAEGVETAAVLDFVKALNFDLAQGYEIGKPIPENRNS